MATREPTTSYAEDYDKCKEVLEAMNHAFPQALTVCVAAMLTVSGFWGSGLASLGDDFMDTFIPVSYILAPAGILFTAAGVGDEWIRAKAIILNPVTSTNLALLLGPSLAQSYADGLKVLQESKVQ